MQYYLRIDLSLLKCHCLKSDLFLWDHSIYLLSPLPVTLFTQKTYTQTHVIFFTSFKANNLYNCKLLKYVESLYRWSYFWCSDKTFLKTMLSLLHTQIVKFDILFISDNFCKKGKSQMFFSLRREGIVWNFKWTFNNYVVKSLIIQKYRATYTTCANLAFQIPVRDCIIIFQIEITRTSAFLLW